MLSVGLSPPEPAFKFVLVFIALLLSDIFKASRMPIANTPNSNVADWLESVALNGDDGWAPQLWNLTRPVSRAI